jgi:predicted Na+-dependent transporter
MLSALARIGARAQWVLAAGVVAALVVPGPGALLAGTLPFWVTLLFGLAMTRIDLPAVARRAIAPRRLARNLGLLALLMGVTPAAFWAVGTTLGLDPAHIEAVVYTASGPPLGSSAAFCLILGLDAAFALELTVLGSFLAPFTMPIVARLLLGEAVPIDAPVMTLRLALMIGVATAGALAARRLLGARRIETHARAFDGVSSITMVLFLFPLFHGMPELIGSMPAFAAATLALAIAVNLGVQAAALPLCRLAAPRETAGATALIWGNRNAALALASLPPDPLFTLYVALYQFPMYFTPLVMRPLVAARA